VRAYWQIDPSSKPAAADEETWVRTFRAVNEGSFAIGNVRERTGEHGRYTAEAWENLVTKMLEGEQIDNMDFAIDSLFSDRFVEAFNDFDVEQVRALAQSVAQ
jgi:NitT/TauT family transport system substrate-binding protein